MGLLLSVVISYAGAHEAVECLKHLLSGVVPNNHPDFQDLVEYYSAQLRKATNASSTADWGKECGQGYLSLTEDKNGKLKSAAVKYYGDNTNSTAILFSTKISSFGQESLEDSQSNGDYRSDRYIPTKTKTILTNSVGSFSVAQRSRSPTPRETISDSNHNSFTSNSVEPDNKEEGGADEKLTWHYRPLSPTRTPPTLPEIHFQSFDEDKKGEYSEEFLRLIFIDTSRNISHVDSCLQFGSNLAASHHVSDHCSSDTTIRTSRKLIHGTYHSLHLYYTYSYVMNLFKIS